jgi:ElaB/YqjD/DUF883 family membrane-anchored ribosome-binding protein
MSTDVQPKCEAMSDRLSAVAKDIENIRSATKKVATDSVEALRETASGYIEEGRIKAREASRAVQNKVQQQPVKSVLIAAAGGFLLGMFCARR